MRTVTQRVQHASVTIDGQLKSKIGKGLLVLVGIEDKDTQEDIEWLAKKITNLRIFAKKALYMIVFYWGLRCGMLCMGCVCGRSLLSLRF